MKTLHSALDLKLDSPITTYWTVVEHKVSEVSNIPGPQNTFSYDGIFDSANAIVIQELE